MGLLIWTLLGIIAGWLTSLLLENSKHRELFTDVILGILGAIGAGFIMNAIAGQGLTATNWYSIALATIGAMIVIWLDKTMGRTI